MSSDSFEKRIIEKVKTIKCMQPDCRSAGEDNLELVVFGNSSLKRAGFMCSSCFIDGDLIKALGKIQHHVLPIRQFIISLSKQYLKYQQLKAQPKWPPNMMQAEKKKIRGVLNEMQKELLDGILQIVSFIDEAGKVLVQEIKQNNYDNDFEKLVGFVEQQEDSERFRIDISKELKKICDKVEKVQGLYKIKNEDEIKKKNQVLIVQFKRKVDLAEETLTKLIEVQKRAIKYLIQ